MIIKKPSILLSSYCGWYSLTTGGPISSTSSTHSRSTRQRQCPRKESNKRRCYATVADDLPKHLSWPDPLRGHSCPTPYQIFALKQNAPYTKARFYELVKVYHPDRQSPSHAHGIPHTIRIERYRLIVAAHTILSDPTKRSAYDRFGAGWNGKPEAGAPPDSWPHQPGPFTQHSWRTQAHGDPDIWHNATWEDWERFHARHRNTADGVSQERNSPLYLQNTYFLSLVIILAMMGGSLNYNRAQDAGTHFIEQRDIVHDRAAKELRRVRQEVGQRAKDERIQWFLRQREATMGLAGSDVETVREERIDKLLPDREICRSEDVKEKDV